jgi:hypothetical protein
MACKLDQLVKMQNYSHTRGDTNETHMVNSDERGSRTFRFHTFTQLSAYRRAARSDRYGATLSGSGGRVAQNIASRLAAGVTYNFSAWVRVAQRGASWGSVWFRLDKYADCGTGAFGTAQAANNTALGWQQLTLNYHDYMMPNHYPAALTNDEANFVSKFSWCLGTNGQLCSGLGMGDGTSWTGANKPWIWGEIDVGTSTWNQVNPAAQSGEGRLRFLHNSTWAGMCSALEHLR